MLAGCELNDDLEGCVILRNVGDPTSQSGNTLLNSSENQLGPQEHHN